MIVSRPSTDSVAVVLKFDAPVRTVAEWLVLRSAAPTEGKALTRGALAPVLGIKIKPLNLIGAVSCDTNARSIHVTWSGLAVPCVSKRTRWAASNDLDDGVRVCPIRLDPGLFAIAEDQRKRFGAPLRRRALKTVEVHDNGGAPVVHDSIRRAVRAPLVRKPDPNMGAVTKWLPFRRAAATQ